MAALKSHIASLSVACLRESRENGELLSSFLFVLLAVVCLPLMAENGHCRLPSKPQQQKSFATHQFYKKNLHSLSSSFKHDLKSHARFSTQSWRHWNDNAIFPQHTLINFISLCDKRKLSVTPNIWTTRPLYSPVFEKLTSQLPVIQYNRTNILIPWTSCWSSQSMRITCMLLFKIFILQGDPNFELS